MEQHLLLDHPGGELRRRPDGRAVRAVRRVGADVVGAAQHVTRGTGGGLRDPGAA